MLHALRSRSLLCCVLVPLFGALGACLREPDPLAAAPSASAGEPGPAPVALEARPGLGERQSARTDDSAEAFGPWIGPSVPPSDAIVAADPAAEAAGQSASVERLDLLAEDLLRRAFRAEREVARLGRERETARAAQDPLAETLDADYLAAVKAWNDLGPQLSQAHALEHLAWIPRTARAGTTDFAALYRTDSLEDLYLENITLDRSWAARTEELVERRFAAGLYEVSAFPSSAVP